MKSEYPEPRRSWGGDGGVRTAGQPIVSGALQIRNSSDTDLCPGTPQERDGEQETHGSPQADKAWQEGRSRVFRKPGTVRPERQGSSQAGRGDCRSCGDPHLPAYNFWKHPRTFGHPAGRHSKEARTLRRLGEELSQHGRSTSPVAEVERTHGPFRIDQHEIRITADYSKENNERRKAFLALRPRLRQLEMKYGLLGPARMWVTKNGVSKDFYNPY
ncbi:hypothetical protein NDU88_004003 [Pleurodeles waltl]|uniref:Uncharacterized protein n=1 Tax=Pleurodeles waltl TaxID=8319 RepID=A0AAV7VHH8_PLEWA|nr:hypothetical protein NDU88_004003 [Pleurodeles waltl]